MRATALAVVVVVATATLGSTMGCKNPRDYSTDGVVYVKVSNRSKVELQNGRLGFVSLPTERKLFDTLAPGHTIETRLVPRLEFPIVVRLTMNGRELSTGWLGDISVQPLRASVVVYADSITEKHSYD